MTDGLRTGWGKGDDSNAQVDAYADITPVYPLVTGWKSVEEGNDTRKEYVKEVLQGLVNTDTGFDA